METFLYLCGVFAVLALLVQSRWSELVAILILAVLAWIVDTIASILGDRSLA